MGKPVTISDVRREVSRAFTKLRILSSDTIAVLPGDHPMQPSVIAGPAGGPVLGPASSTDNALAVWDGVTGDLLQDSTVEWNNNRLSLAADGVDAVIATTVSPAGVSGDLLITTGGSIAEPGTILIQPAQSLGTTGVDNTFAGGRSGSASVGGKAIIVGGDGSDDAGGEVHIDGGGFIGMGSKGNVVIQGGFIVFPNGGFTTPVQIDAGGGLLTDTIADSGAGSVTMSSDLVMSGADIDLAGGDLLNAANVSLSGHTHALVSGDLDDVVIVGIADNDILVWDPDGLGAFKNESFAEAGVSVVGHTHLEADITDLGSYLPLGGGTMSGDVNFGGGNITNITSITGHTVAGDIVFLAGGIDFGLGDEIKYAASEIQVWMNSAQTVGFKDDKLRLQVLLDMQANRIDLDTLSKSSIRGDSATVTIEAALVDVMTLAETLVTCTVPLAVSDDLIVTGGDINLATPTTQKLTFGDGDTYFYELVDDLFALYVGGALNFIASPTATSFTQNLEMASGKILDFNGVAKIVLDADADTKIFADSDDLIKVEVGGTQRFTLSNTIASLALPLNMGANTLSNAANVQVNDGGLVGFDPDNAFTFNEDASIIASVNAVTALTITPTVLDGNSVLRLTGFAGRRGTFLFGWNTTNTAATRVQYVVGLSVTSTKRGYLMPRSGSIVKITMIIDINAYAGTEINAQVYKNNTVFTNCKAVVTTPVVANGQFATATFSLGTHTFAAGDDITMARVRIGTSATTDDTGMMIEVEYDD